VDKYFLKKRPAAGHRAGAASFTLPELVLEIQPGFVAGARLDSTHRAPRHVQRMEVEDLAAGAVEALFNRPNVNNLAELERAVRAVVQVVGNGNGRLGLLIPDATTRVAMLSFETLPENRKEVEALVRWRIKEMVPFSPEEARISYQIVRGGQGSIELLAVAAKSSVLSEYESVLEPWGRSPALILPSTMALLPLLPDHGGSGQLLIHACSGWVTVAVVSGGTVQLWRTRQVSPGEGADLASEGASEISRALAAASDRLKLEISDVWLCPRPPATAELATELAQRLSREVRVVAPGSELASNLAPDDRARFERFGASLAGLISNAG